MPGTATSGITSSTIKNLLLDAGAVYLNYGVGGERLIGATEGGNGFKVTREIREIPMDGAKGKIKGLRRITKENADLKVNLKELSTNNILLALAGSAATAPTLNTTVPAEYLGLGTAAAETFTFAHAPIIGTIKFYADGIEVPATYGIDYTVATAALTIIGINFFALSAKITTSYQWNSGGANTFDSITSDADIAITDYATNVALVAKISGSGTPIIIILSNPLSDGDFEIKTKEGDEGTIEMNLAAHYDPAALTTPIYEIRYPKVP